METYPDITPEQRTLVQSLIDRTATKVQIKQLDAQMKDNFRLRAFYIDQMRMHTHLHQYYDGHQMPVILVDNKPRVTRSKIIAFAAGFTGVGIAAAVTIMALFNEPEQNSQQEVAYSSFLSTPNPSPVARVTGMEGVTWETSTGDIGVGKWLSPGKLELKEGVIEITYDSGSSVVIKGPSIYYLEENNKGYLEDGQIHAYSPPTVAEFSIDTPDTQMVDLGTSFGVSTSSSSGTDIHVFDGLVKATALNDDNWQELYAGDALSISMSESFTPHYENFTSQPEKFNWQPDRPSSSKSLNYLHYDFDTDEGSFFSDSGSGIDGETYPAYKTNEQKKEGKLSWIETGKFGNALSLHGGSRFLQTSFKGIAENEARTVAFWVKLNPDNKRLGTNPLLMWGTPQPGKLWAVDIRSFDWGKSWNVRTNTVRGLTQAKGDIGGGDWHHVVSVFTGGDNADAGSNVLHYIDGVLQGRSASQSRLVDTKTSSKLSAPLTIGTSVGTPQMKQFNTMVKNRMEKGKFHTFDGLIDELYIIDDALSPAEIVHLMETNTLPR